MALSTAPPSLPTSSCRTCAHATFAQWFTNPVIAFCAERGGRQVASVLRRCKYYKYRDNSDRPIKHFYSYEPDQWPDPVVPDTPPTPPNAD